MTSAPNTSQEIDAAIKAQMAQHYAQSDGRIDCGACGDIWPCQYIIQASITLKLTAIAQILSIQGVSNGETTRQGQR